MRLTKRQLKRIIREEYSRLKRRGLIREMRELADGHGPDTEFAAICESSFGIPCGPMSSMYKLFMKIYDCWGGPPSKAVSPEECAAMLNEEEMMLVMEGGDFLNVLVECQHAECREMVNYCLELESYLY